jgi:hypothetical protein
MFYYDRQSKPQEKTRTQEKNRAAQNARRRIIPQQEGCTQGKASHPQSRCSAPQNRRNRTPPRSDYRRARRTQG